MSAGDITTPAEHAMLNEITVELVQLRERLYEEFPGYLVDRALREVSADV